tara:strand:- start:1463 stop:1873 length:411 start_codon:yes stop_codon:yes gene_type:complete
MAAPFKSKSVSEPFYYSENMEKRIYITQVADLELKQLKIVIAETETLCKKLIFEIAACKEFPCSEQQYYSLCTRRQKTEQIWTFAKGKFLDTHIEKNKETKEKATLRTLEDLLIANDPALAIRLITKAKKLTAGYR